MGYLLIFLTTFALGQQKFDLLDFDVNLDEAPETRWKAVLSAKKDEILDMIHFVESLANYFERKYIAHFLISSNVFLPEYIKEMQGAAEILQIDASTLILGNFVNEFYSRCTTIVAPNAQGEIVFARNLDYVFGAHIRELAVNIHFYRGGKLLYHSVGQAGFFGVTTGMRPGSYAVSLNQRDLNDNFVLWEMVGLVTGSQISAFAIRFAFEHYSKYTQALNYLTSVPLIVGEYFIIGGTDEGAVLTRNRRYLSDMWELDEENWYLLQTNYDHWLPQPSRDDRVTIPKKRMDDLGQENVNEVTLFNLLTIEPTFRPSTLISAVCNPTTGYWSAVSWKSFKETN